MKKIFNCIRWSLLIIVFLSACKKDDNSVVKTPDQPVITETGQPAGPADETTIGPDGGIASSSDGLLSVDIPQGALSDQTVISIQPLTNQAPLGLGMGYRLGPEGLTFDKPVILTFHYTDGLLSSTPPDFLWIVYQENDGTWKAMLKSTVDLAAKTVSVETTHFSDWSLGKFVDLTLTPVAKTLKKGEKTNTGSNRICLRRRIFRNFDGLTSILPFLTQIFY